jgi:hypothetical protein
MKLSAIALVTTAALLHQTSAYEVWVNRKALCGGDSYLTKASTHGTNLNCFNVVLHSDLRSPVSLTYFSTGDSCIATIYRAPDCASGSELDSTSFDSSCLGRSGFLSYSLHCF